MVTNCIYTYFATGDKNVCQRGGKSMYILYSSIISHDFYKISKRPSPSNGSKKSEYEHKLILVLDIIH